ncbi:hypothetical protein NEPTK9_001711 [Candidatus Neptunochlamydia vexilliferae]|uniref:Uncharacterized protein n=1 Tax=Candidatus Neptunichlamydia vexilliferae TaxID=1651774 RepID=A0ABS0B1V3_9BACT|nr:hypothetical protein [Candidatus Neptunochlamydia vexilliferae]
MEKGDVQPIETVFEFAKIWYGNHLNRNWTKWTIEEAQEIFDHFGLNHPHWDLPKAQSRF